MHALHGAAVESVGQGGRRGLVEDPLHRDPRQPAGISGGLALGVIEVGRHRDHRGLHLLAEVGGGVVTSLRRMLASNSSGAYSRSVTGQRMRTLPWSLARTV
jgi:hypothetical protein